MIDGFETDPARLIRSFLERHVSLSVEQIPDLVNQFL
jgi:hypothetical protein